MSSRNNFKRFGPNTSPCRTTYIFSNISPWWPPHFAMMWHSGTYFESQIKKLQRIPGLSSWIGERRAGRFIKSNADLNHQNMYTRGGHWLCICQWFRSVKNILSMAFAFGLNPFCKGSPKERHSFANCRRLFRIPSKTVPIAGAIVILRLLSGNVGDSCLWRRLIKASHHVFGYDRVFNTWLKSTVNGLSNMPWEYLWNSDGIPSVPGALYTFICLSDAFISSILIGVFKISLKTSSVWRDVPSSSRNMNSSIFFINCLSKQYVRWFVF